ncbi:MULTISPECIES: hypothetical protein [unclassified Lysobacter]|uniref:hypothetical protein n=1 Tax=unclassified Lysobacter TaxID=2635362 RepID=UPI0012FA223A|nr:MULTISPECIES: hypothetical protein [unclassified Lysobacter]
MKNYTILAAALLLGACAQESPLALSYKRVAGQSPQEIARIVCQMSPTDRVDIYLYGVEERRPSDYGLFPEGCIDSETVDIAVRLAAHSTANSRTFALTELIHEAPEEILRGRVDAFDASAECSRFYSEDSPCHDLARDIDKVYGHKSADD